MDRKKGRVNMSVYRIHRISLVLTVLSSALLLEAKTPGKPEPSWQAKMTALSQTMQELLPELTVKDPDIGKIKRGAKAISSLAHAIQQKAEKQDKTLTDKDPSIAIFSSLFARESKRASDGLEAGHIEYSRQLLKSITGYCIACHTRHDMGPSFSKSAWGSKANTMDPMERAELFAAVRQFDAAIDEYRTLISDKSFAKKYPIEWERGLREALMIAVRVKKDPSLAKDFISRAEKMPESPEFVKEYLESWKTSTNAWEKELATTPTTTEGLKLEAARLLNEARSMQRFPVDHRGDILYLRASSVAHDLLNQSPKGIPASEAMLMEGTAYEVLSNPLIWPIHEMYYEACIRNAPHTNIAKQCYRRYESSVYFGYSGSGGLFLPSETRLNLEQLSRLSQ